MNENYNNDTHPDIAEARNDPRGRVWQNKRKYLRGSVAEVDYDLEPYVTRTQSETGATKSAPRDDLEVARLQQRKHDERRVLF